MFSIRAARGKNRRLCVALRRLQKAVLHDNLGSSRLALALALAAYHNLKTCEQTGAQSALVLLAHGRRLIIKSAAYCLRRARDRRAAKSCATCDAKTIRRERREQNFCAAAVFCSIVSRVATSARRGGSGGVSRASIATATTRAATAASARVFVCRH